MNTTPAKVPSNSLSLSLCVCVCIVFISHLIADPELVEVFLSLHSYFSTASEVLAKFQSMCVTSILHDPFPHLKGFIS
jgi:hypothetical protein